MAFLLSARRKASIGAALTKLSGGVLTADFLVGEFQVRPTERRVLLRGQPVALGARAFDLLLVLIQHRDRVVGKDELLALVWPSVVVEENNLSVQISALRKALGSDAIATIAGRGYRFTAAVAEPVSGGTVTPLVARAPEDRRRTTLSEPRLPHLAYEQIMQKLRGLHTLPELAHEATADPGGSVPAELNSLIGRASAVDETLRLLHATRCLTLTGAGGSGKTRLALALAGRLRDQYDGGVWWVELANLKDPAMLATTIANTLGVSDPHKPVLQAIAERLKGSKALLILDNCEHLIEDCAALAVHLLRTLPLLQVLATSRETLRIDGEAAWVVPPLEVPSAEAVERLDELAQLASVQLLVERIRQHNPKFSLTRLNAVSLVQICRSLEGLPLALELVAGRVGLLTLEQITAQLDDSLRLLTDGNRGGLRHHQTMQAAIQWGCDLLSDSERALFVRLSVFAGGWTLEGAAAVCTGQGIKAGDLPDLLARLERVSMVLASELEGVVRFRMLEPIRQFAFARLQELGLSELVRGQLLDWYVAHCERIVPTLTGADQATGYKALASEVDNVRAVLAWSQRDSLAKGLHLAASLWRFWQVKGHAKEMLSWFEETLPLAKDVSTTIQADAYNAAGVMARTCGVYNDAIGLLETALALRREQGNRRGEAIALNNLAVVARDRYDHAMVERYGRESLKIAQELGDNNLIALGLMHLGTAQRGQERLRDAEESFKQSFRIFDELGEKRALAALLNFLGNLAQAKINGAEHPQAEGSSRPPTEGAEPGGQAAFVSQAQRYYEESLELNQALEDFWGIGISTFNLASLCVDLRDPAGALPVLVQSFAHYRKAGVKHGLEENFGLLAQIARALGHLERAAWCWGVVEQIEQDIGKVISRPQQAGRAQALLELEAQMTAQPFRAARAAGRRERIEDAFRTALSSGDWA